MITSPLVPENTVYFVSPPDAKFLEKQLRKAEKKFEMIMKKREERNDESLL